MSSEAQHAEERVVDTATGAEAPAEISEERVQHIDSTQYRASVFSRAGCAKPSTRQTSRPKVICSIWRVAQAM